MFFLGENRIVQLDVVSVHIGKDLNDQIQIRIKRLRQKIKNKQQSDLKREGSDLVRKSSSTTAEMSRSGLPIPRRIPSQLEDDMMRNLRREVQIQICFYLYQRRRVEWCVKASVYIQSARGRLVHLRHFLLPYWVFFSIKIVNVFILSVALVGRVIMPIH